MTQPEQGTTGGSRAPTDTDRALAWWDRNWKWAVPLAAMVFLVITLAFAGSIALGVFTWMKSSTVAQEAIGRARSHPEITRALGEPIETGWWVLGNMSLRGSSGEAQLTIPLRGPRGSATLHLEAEKSGGAWSFSYLEVSLGGSGTRVDLLP